MNQSLVDSLNKITEISKILGQVYREKAYKKASIEIEKLTYVLNDQTWPMFSSSKIPGVGEGIKKKIKEFVTTGKIELENLALDKQYLAIQTFVKILGVGPVTASSWVKMGLMNLADLRKAISKSTVVLTTTQQHGLNYYDDLNSRIPHYEISLIADAIQSILLSIDKDIIFNVAGSYRRQTKDSGDIDILISQPGLTQPVLKPFLDRISTDVRYVATISSGSERITFLYKSPVSNKVRQIDILKLAIEKYWSGLLYFTGSYQFNVAQRAWAKNMNYRLNQNGLFKLSPNGKQTLVPANSEEEIFALLKLKYVEPPMRTDSSMVIPL